MLPIIRLSTKSIKFRSLSIKMRERKGSFLANLKAFSGATRIERDTLGEIEVPKDCLWGAQTQRSMLNFQIGDESELMPKEIITAMVTIKKAAARVNYEMKGITKEISEAIQKAADEVKRFRST